MTDFQEWLVGGLCRITTGGKHFRKVLTPMGPLVFFGAIIVLFLFGLALDSSLEVQKFLQAPYSYVAGIPLLVSGALLIIWSILQFVDVDGTPIQFNSARRLIDTGPYEYTRNPMLAGWFILLFGVGLISQSIIFTFLFTPIFIALNLWELKNIEEPKLVIWLGKEYAKYMEKTPMFFPRMKRRIHHYR